jgi:hypothetical protein
MSGKRFDGQGRPRITLTRAEIEYAMEHCSSAKQAARFLNMSYETFKKNAQQYRYKNTKKTLFDKIKNPAGKGISRNNNGNPNWVKYPLDEILKGEHPDFNPYSLQDRLLKTDVYLDRRCEVCSFYETRYEDGKAPLKLEWKDGDRTNHKIENLRWLCYNHYYIYVGWHGTSLNRDRYKNRFDPKNVKKKKTKKKK